MMLALISALCATFIGPGEAQKMESNGLRISLVRVQPNLPNPLFAAELFNTGQEALVLNLGMMLGNGRKQYADAITLSLSDAKGNTIPLELMSPAILGGRVDPFVVPLPAGAVFTLPVNLASYISPKGHVGKMTLPRGRYQLTGSYTGVGVPIKSASLDMRGVSLMPYWIGTVRSEAVVFTIRIKRNIRLGDEH
jgi:hypothetical protein